MLIFTLIILALVLLVGVFLFQMLLCIYELEIVQVPLAWYRRRRERILQEQRDAELHEAELELLYSQIK